MNFWSPFPFVRLALAFAIGILLSDILNISDLWIGYSILLVAVAYLSVVVLQFASFQSNAAGILSLILFAQLGFIYHDSFSGNEAHEIEAEAFSGKVVSFIEERGRYNRFVIEIDGVFADSSIERSRSRVLVYLEVDTAGSDVNYGDQILVIGEPQLIKAPTNPSAFDFSRYWSLKGIHHQIFLEPDDIDILKTDQGNPILGWSYQARTNFRTTLSENIPGREESAIAQALILGVKDGLDNQLKDAYGAAGAMHVLAVSGLHVGILYLFILYVLKPLRKTRHGEKAIALISLGLLWFYALLTGLSPSVQRAVVMFSIFIVGNLIGRSRNVYNSLALSAFVLLIINPSILFEVGFQLSYLAVFGIVYLHPRIYGLWSPSNFIVNKAWELTCVSFSAQLATFPLGLFYFHQFPTLFLVSNLIVIPASFLVLIIGILLLLFGSFSGLMAGWLGFILGEFLTGLNHFVFYIHALDFSVIEGVSITSFQLVLIYLSLLAIGSFLLWKRFLHVFLTGALMLFLIGVEVNKIVARSNKVELVCYDVNGSTLIDLRSGFNSELVCGQKIDQKDIQFVSDPHRLSSSLLTEGQPRLFSSWPEVIPGVQLRKWNGFEIARIYQPVPDNYTLSAPCRVDFLIVSDNAIREFSKAIQYFSPGTIIIDSSNSLKNSITLLEQSEHTTHRVVSTKLSGAAVIEL